MKKNGIIILVLVGIQFIRPDKNQSDNQINKIEVSTEINQILAASCYDCHSNKTNYPWYNSIAPVSWFLANHVNEGKEHLNFSEWKNYNTKQKNHILEEIKEVLEEHEMPLKSYLLIHEEAKLTSNNVEKILKWVDEVKSSRKNHE